jgi:integrase/recombinase XerC
MAEIISYDVAKSNIYKMLEIFIKFLKQETSRAYRNDILDYLNSLDTFNLTNTIEYFQALVEKGYAKTTIERKKAALSRFFQFLLEQSFIEVNPFTTQTFKLAMKKITQDSSETMHNLSHKSPAHHLKWEEIERLISVCKDDSNILIGKRDLVIMLLGVYEGLRRSEISELKWSDIREDINGMSLYIRKAKGGAAVIELHNRVREALEEFKNLLQEREIKTEYIVISFSNNSYLRKLSNKSINEIVKKRAKQAKVKNYEEISAHDLRHSCAVQLLLHGAGVEKVSRHLRHKNIQTTMGYLKTLELHENSAVKLLP